MGNIFSYLKLSSSIINKTIIYDEMVQKEEMNLLISIYYDH